ncbi:MAG: hypothetical protein LBB11_03235 [Puniceicoccales bacterium]|jgi:hypothetical protein|nr:hypothetical protein [Puniceicoccales bacterium]
MGNKIKKKVWVSLILLLASLGAYGWTTIINKGKTILGNEVKEFSSNNFARINKEKLVHTSGTTLSIDSKILRSISHAIFRKNLTILIQNKDQSVQYEQFWLYDPDFIPKDSNKSPYKHPFSHSIEEKCTFFYLPDVPLFVPVHKNTFYNYRKVDGGIKNKNVLGKGKSEKLRFHSDVICCMKLFREENAKVLEKTNRVAENRNEQNVIEQIVFYRYSPANRYFFLSPAAKLHHLIDDVLTFGCRKPFELQMGIDGRIASGKNAKTRIADFPNTFTFQNHYLIRETSHFFTMHLKEKGGFVLSALANQGWIGNETGGSYGLPGINLVSDTHSVDLTNKGQNKWVTTKVSIGNTQFLTHHIFLNQTFTAKLEWVLLGQNFNLLEGLKDSDTKVYGDLVSFWAKSTLNEEIRKDWLLMNVFEKIEDGLKNKNNPSHQQYKDYCQAYAYYKVAHVVHDFKVKVEESIKLISQDSEIVSEIEKITQKMKIIQWKDEGIAELNKLENDLLDQDDPSDAPIDTIETGKACIEEEFQRVLQAFDASKRPSQLLKPVSRKKPVAKKPTPIARSSARRQQRRISLSQRRQRWNAIRRRARAHKGNLTPPKGSSRKPTPTSPRTMRNKKAANPQNQNKQPPKQDSNNPEENQEPEKKFMGEPEKSQSFGYTTTVNTPEKGKNKHYTNAKDLVKKFKENLQKRIDKMTKQLNEMQKNPDNFDYSKVNAMREQFYHLLNTLKQGQVMANDTYL